MSEQFLGEIRLMSFNFAPKGWAQCTGQLLPINQNAALFSLLGTQFGGNGTVTFGLPDMRGRAPVHESPSYALGQMGGTENITLTVNQIPQHNHLAQALNAAGTTDRAINNVLAQSAATGTAPGAVYTGASNLTPLNPASIQPYGSSQPHNNMQPYLAMTYCIALIGIFPSRN